jgi:hypothetical protein
MVGNRIHNEVSSLLAWEAGEKKWEVFAQFWEVVRSSTSHLFIDNQLLSLKLRKTKNLRTLTTCIYKALTKWRSKAIVICLFL